MLGLQAGALLFRLPLTFISDAVGWWLGVATGIAHALAGVWKRLQSADRTRGSGRWDAIVALRLSLPT